MNINDIINKTIYLNENFRFIYWKQENEFTCIDLLNGKRINIDYQLYALLSVSIGKTVKEASSYINDESLEVFHDIISRLYANNLLVDKLSNGNIEIYNSKPIEIMVVEITGKCNANCIFCYGKDSRNNKDFTFEELKELIKSYRSIGGQAVAISGGEPTISEHIVPFIKMLKENGLLLAGIGTNGSLFNNELIDCIKGANIVDGISFSLDSINLKEHSKIRGIKNLGEIVFENIQLLIKHNIPVIINTVINKKMGDIVEFGNILSELGVSKWRIIQPFGIDKNDIMQSDFYYSTDEELNILAKAYFTHQKLGWMFSLMSDTFINCLHTSYNIPDRILDNKLCGHRSRSLYIKANGDVLRCNISREKAVANVHKYSLKEIWENELTHEIKRPNLKNYETCKHCVAKQESFCNVNTFCPEVDIAEGKCNQRLEYLYNKYVSLIN